MQNITLSLLFVLGLSSCGSRAQQVDNTKPMYGEVPKSNEYKEVDEDFKKECLAQFGTIDSSVRVQIDNAWRYFYHNDLKTAMKRFNQAWLLDSECSDSYFGFAALMDMQGKKIESERFYKLGIERDKSKTRSRICYKRIADCKEQLQDFQGTIEAYKKWSELEPENAFVFKKLGYFYMQTENTVDALKAYGKAIELDPKDAVTYNNRAYLYQTRREYASAIVDYSKAIDLDPKYISATVNRGITKMQTSDFNGAKKDFETCVGLDEKSGELRRMLALSKLGLNDKGEACKDLEIARQLGDAQAGELIKQNCR